MQSLIWLSFLVFVVVMVGLDLGVFHRRPHVIGIREALVWTAVWVVCALVFNVIVYFLYGRNWLGWADVHSHHLTGRQAALQFFTGYLIEKSLSLDNIFVIALIFAFFHVPRVHQHRILFWGILGAVVMRGVMIAVGVTLIERFEWMIYVFGAILLISAAKMLVRGHVTVSPERNAMVRLVKRFWPVSAETESGRFFVRESGRRAVTPLLLALVLVESADVLFALDSIPAIFAVTRDPFLVFTSNIFAILGLRSLYFALAGMLSRFRYLQTSLVFVLGYVGVKMVLSEHYPIPNHVSLAIIAAILALGVAASMIAGAPSHPAASASSVPPRENN